MTNQKTKHLDVITRYFYPVAAGIETNILETYSVLADMGWDVVIHTSRDTYNEKNSLQEEEKLRGLNISRYKWSWWGCMPKIDWDQSYAVCLHNFNIFPHTLLLAYVILRKLLHQRTPYIFLTPHGGFNPEWSIFNPVSAWIKRTYHYSLGAVLINKTVHGVRAVSNWEQKEMITHGIASHLIRVIPNGMEDEAFQDLDQLASKEVKDIVQQYAPYSITVSRIHPIKNYETTLRALALMPKEVKHIIVGPIASTDYKLQLEKMIAQLGLSDRVLFAGVIRGIDKYYMIKHAYAMVHMAKWESFCNAVHEGLSQGTTCIVADNTALSYLIQPGSNGFLIDTYDNKALAQQMTWVYTHQHDRELVQMNERNIQNYQVSWKEVAKKMNDFYLSESI